MNGSLGRYFGSFGLALDGVHTSLQAEPADDITADGPSAERAETFAREFAAALGLPGGVRITVEQAIPEHAGLGSGTQLGLAVGMTYAGLYRLDLGARDVARLLGRGARSGIGVGAFETGGVLLDGGRVLGEDGPPAPIVSRIDFPPSWRILLVMDRRAQGLHGLDEAKAFNDRPPFPEELSARLCRLLLMVALPALAEGDLARFGQGVAELQGAIGDHFAFAQGGRFSSPAVAEVLSWLREGGYPGVGQSSWGPTGFVLLDGEDSGRRLLDSARKKWAGDADLHFMLCRGRNEGSRIDLGRPSATATGAMRG